MNESCELEQKLADIGAAERLWQAGDTLLVAVSGGPDSMALLHALHRLSERLGLTIAAAHVDHRFRGGESEREAQGVRAFAASLGIPCESAAIDVPAYIEETGMNLQAAARLLRYRFLHESAARLGASRIALAHHADDQAETVLMRVLRGTSTSGLAGIPLRRREKNVELIRPLLRMYKKELIRYCEDNSISYYVDSSNEKRDYFRNEIRLDALPYLSRYNDRLTESLCRLADIASAEDELLRLETEAAYTRLVTAKPGECEVSAAAFAGLHVALQRRLIKLILNYLGLENEPTPYERVETIRMASLAEAPATWKTDAGRGVIFRREYDLLRWTAPGTAGEDAGQPASSFVYKAPEEGDLAVPQSGLRFRFERLAPGSQTERQRRWEALFDLNGLTFPLTVRSRRPGDRMTVLGLNGSKKVQDMFIDAKIAPSRRGLVPLLTDGTGELLWIPGVRRSAKALPRKESSALLKVTVQEGGNGCDFPPDRG
ncbi:tRNA lysidine(34) synthetase TilS [Paenibacillus beijingensis]|uniref:tRNA(Ile)-lysidine synthase n=1 Tax=Paenibacillus beijingensis TaxID=1126833 RepID=A0A0D5NIK2_9BACL|nr:tRNA lysidine(34) synthetase TilS [Paenibacillus beijingensis]AJY74950.1 hypothetical protein VN24_10555 [Paenibacillus beijingensis]